MCFCTYFTYLQKSQFCQFSTLLHWADDMKCWINSVKDSSSKKKKIPTDLPYFCSACYANITIFFFWPNFFLLRMEVVYFIGWYVYFCKWKDTIRYMHARTHARTHPEILMCLENACRGKCIGQTSKCSTKCIDLSHFSSKK